MRLTPLQIQKLSEKVLEAWKAHNLVEFKDDEKRVLARVIAAVREDYDKEALLEKDVQKMLEDLERSHGGQFERYKMYPLLKQKLAKERKIIL